MKRFAIRTLVAAISAGVLATAPGVASARTLYSDDGISELNAPDHWTVRADIGRAAALRVSNTQADYHLSVYTYLPEETDADSLDAFAEAFAANLEQNIEKAQVSEARRLMVNGRPAIQYEIRGGGKDRFIYLTTAVEGKRAKHQIVATISEADYAAHEPDLQKAIRSFRESPKKRAAKERIDLVFDWPREGQSTFTMQTRNTDRKGTHELQMSGVTTVRPLKNEELLVSTRVTDFKMGPGTDQAQDDFMQALMEQATTEIPDYVVNADGEFVRVENLRAYYKRLETALMNVVPDGAKEAKKAVKALMKNAFTEDTLMASLQDGWNKQVQGWAGASYAVGETYTYDTPYQMPALGDGVFPMRVSEKLVGRVPCQPADKAKSCVKLVQTSTLSGADVNQAMQAYLAQVFKEMAGDDAPAVAVDGFEVVKTVTLVTDPDTLLPYEESESEVKTTRLRVNGEKQTGKDVSETVSRYTY